MHRSNEQMLLDACQESGAVPRILCKGDDVRTLLAWANSEIGVAVVPQSAIGLVPSNQLVYKRVVEPELTVRKALFWMKNRSLSAAARHFVNMVVEPTGKTERFGE